MSQDLVTKTDTPEQETEESLREELEMLDQVSRDIDALIEVARIKNLAELIEAKGSPEMKAKLKPFKDHYDGDVVTLLKKRTQQHFENDVQQELSRKDPAEKAKYQQNPNSYFSPEEKDARMQAAYDKTVAEAQKLADSLQQVADQVEAPAQPASDANGRRMFSRKQ